MTVIAASGPALDLPGAIRLVFHDGTLSGATTLDETYPNFLRLDPSGATKVVTLSTAATSAGRWHAILNSGSATELLTINNPAGGTLTSLDAGDCGIFACSNSGTPVWRLMGRFSLTEGSDEIADTNNYYTTDTVNGAFDALGVQLGGDTDATYNFTEANVATDDTAVFANLEALDLKWGDLASVANTEGAALVGLEDAAGNLVATDVEAGIAEIFSLLVSAANGEGASLIGIENSAAYWGVPVLEPMLNELATQLGGTTSSTFAFAEQNVLADDDFIYDALEKLDRKWGDLASVANGEGAALVAVEDAAATFVATTVETVLAEVATPITLTAAGEAGETISVTVGGPAQVCQYIASLYEATMIEAVAAAFTMAETGAGAEVSTTAQARLVFTTDAAGAAIVSVTDVATASGKTMYLEIRPAGASAGTGGGATGLIAITFN